LRHWEDAAISFRKASNYLAGDQLPDQSDYCLEKCAECYIEMGELEMAASLYVLIAQGCVQVYNPPPHSTLYPMPLSMIVIYSNIMLHSFFPFIISIFNFP
jgi:hypothetical protein